MIWERFFRTLGHTNDKDFPPEMIWDGDTLWLVIVEPHLRSLSAETNHVRLQNLDLPGYTSIRHLLQKNPLPSSQRPMFMQGLWAARGRRSRLEQQRCFTSNPRCRGVPATRLTASACIARPRAINFRRPVERGRSTTSLPIASVPIAANSGGYAQ